MVTSQIAESHFAVSQFADSILPNPMAGQIADFHFAEYFENLKIFRKINYL